MPLIADVAKTCPLLPTAITTADATITRMSDQKFKHIEMNTLKIQWWNRT